MGRTQIKADVENFTLQDRVRPLLDEFRSYGVETEKNRGPLPDVVRKVKEIGLVRAFVPRQFGGLEADIGEWLQALRLLASAEMSSAWLAGLAGAHNFVVTKFDAKVQQEIWGQVGPDAMVSSATALMEDGIATRENGGIRVSGRWRFSSGVAVADWTMLFLQVKEPGSEEIENYWALMPKSDYEILDTWYVAGMKGTGSLDVVVKDVFVPGHRIGGPGMDVKEDTRARYDNPMFEIPFRVMFPILFAPVVLGGAEGLLELYREMLLKRRAALSGIPLGEMQVSQIRLAEAVVRLRAVARLLGANWTELEYHARTGEPISAKRQLDWKSDQAFAGREAVRTIDALIERSGSAIYFEGNPMQRFWRDLHVAGGHTRFDTDLAMEQLGRELLGIPPDPRWI